MGESAPLQNPYDNPEFFAGYTKLDRFGEGWSEAIEHEALLELMPVVAGARVADLGCGAGQWALHFAERGAAEVLAVDLSERMLEVAWRERAHPAVRYVRAPLETVELGEARFDLVFSSLAFHYIEDYGALMERVARALKPGGVLLFTTEHPVYTARDPSSGWCDASGSTHWALEEYSSEGARDYRWFIEGVRKYHRTISTLINGVIDAGLVIDRVLEPMPTAEQAASRPGWANEHHRPTFLLVRASKR